MKDNIKIQVSCSDKNDFDRLVSDIPKLCVGASVKHSKKCETIAYIKAKSIKKS